MSKILLLFLMVSLLVVGGCGGSASKTTVAPNKAAASSQTANTTATVNATGKTTTGEAQGTMQLEVKNNGQTFRVALNKSQAAKDFYPPQKLKTQDAVVAHATKGTLAYFIPWGNLTFFYKDYAPVSADLIEIGKVVSGDADLEKLRGKLEITAAK